MKPKTVLRTHRCRVCKAFDVHPKLDLGPQALQNRYNSNQHYHQLLLGVCGRCGVLQSVNPPPKPIMASPHKWLRYNEPDGHLNQHAEYICNFFPTRTAVGMSYKDDALLELIKSPPPDGSGKADLVVCRHQLGHARNPVACIRRCLTRLKVGGHIYLEVTEARDAFQRLDYNMIWEERMSYFTNEKFRTFIRDQHLRLDFNEEIADFPQNLITAVVSPTDDWKRVEWDFSPDEAVTFCNAFWNRRHEIRAWVSQCRDNGTKMCVFGAGHTAAAFINYNDISSYLYFVCDDDHNLHHLKMPGSGLQILPPDHIAHNDIGLCILALHPRHHDTVVERYGRADMKFASIYPKNPYRAIDLLEPSVPSLGEGL